MFERDVKKVLKRVLTRHQLKMSSLIITDFSFLLWKIAVMSLNSMALLLVVTLTI